MERSGILSKANSDYIRTEFENQKKRIYNNQLSQGGCEKELPPQFQLTSISFNQDTRTTKLEFLQTTQYRTIEKYVTRNYIKHPVYSEWKTKYKKISKSIKLTNSELETLDTHNDSLIQLFSSIIILELNDENLVPSWFIAKILKAEYDEKISNIEKSFQKKKNIFQAQKQNYFTDMDDISKKRYPLECTLSKYEKQKEKLQSSILKCQKNKKSIFFVIITLGFYGYFISKKRKDKLTLQLASCDEEIAKLENEIAYFSNKIKEFDNKIGEIRKDFLQYKEGIEQEKNIEKEFFEQKLNEIQPLQEEYNTNNKSFILLKDLGSLKYSKIIGCYIIHNRENDRYYVGQSKDVLTRLKQHFKGTEPANIIFAEDYFKSAFTNKEYLFEVKIIPCETKDELDRLEKELIEVYDAWQSGYNRTKGNN